MKMKKRHRLATFNQEKIVGLLPDARFVLFSITVPNFRAANAILSLICSADVLDSLGLG